MKKIGALFCLFCFLFCLLCLPLGAADGSSQAQALPLIANDSAHVGTISTEKTARWYVLQTGDKDAYYAITIHNENGTDMLHAKVYNTRDAELADVGYYTRAGQSDSEDVRLTANGTYYIKVYFEDRGVGNYTIRAVPKIDEAKNDRNGAWQIERNQRYTYAVDGAGDEDWYLLQTDDQTLFYSFYLKNENGTKNVFLEVYEEASDTPVLEIDNHLFAGKEDEEGVRLEANRRYFVRIGMTDHWGVGSYTFCVSVRADDYGDTMETAHTVPLHKTTQGSIDGQDDLDFFRLVTGSVGGSYTVIYQNISGTTSGHLTLYTESGVELLHVGNWTDAGQTETETIALEANTVYYVKAYFSSSGTGAYSFSVTPCRNGHEAAADWVVTKEPSCLEKGEQCKLCTKCGDAVKVKEIDALGHDGAKVEVVTEATWLSLGNQKITCSRCGEVEYAKDYSKVWILPLILLGAIAVLIGGISYARAFTKRK